ncbi:proline-rich receptor-like protein kinase PERK8 isoform X3 [Lolium perenne]|uniref:proline-rich receptor-like protein kinase PERK8 isoform X3 n=1 Tax=Lolium perenne TaxID=4522 RepID=UPI003A9A1AB1
MWRCAMLSRRSRPGVHPALGFKEPKDGAVVRILDSLTFNNVDLTNDVQPRMSQMFNVSNTVGIRQFQRMAFDSQDYSSGYTHSKINVGLILCMRLLLL